MIDGAGGLDQLFGQGDRLIVLDAIAEDPPYLAMVAATSRSAWSAAQPNAVRRPCCE